MTETPRFPGYDVLDKRETPSWDRVTRDVIDARLSTPETPRFLSLKEFEIAQALCRRILPQPSDRDEVPLAALLDAKLLADSGDGFREAGMPYTREAWRRGLAALDQEARERHDGRGFAALTAAEQDALLTRMQKGKLDGKAWRKLDAQRFFEKRVLADVPVLYYGHPTAWSEIGFGGPASPRGYVRLGGSPRDAWEAAEARPGHEAEAERENRHVV